MTLSKRDTAPDDHAYYALAHGLWGKASTAQGAVQNARFSGTNVTLPKGFHNWMVRLAPDISYVEKDALVYPHCDCGNVACVGHRALLRAQEANDDGP